MGFALYCPETIEEAVRIQTKTGGSYLAGGTVSLVNLHEGKEIGGTRISLSKIRELKDIRTEGESLVIGSMLTMDELEQSEHVSMYAHALWQAAREVGGPQIRNLATLGGNIASASPSSDCAPPLLSMNAVLSVLGKEGKREIPVREFFTGYLKNALSADELIVSVRIPVQKDARSVFRKVGKRNALAVSCLSMALVRNGSGYAVSVGAAGPVPVFCEKTSKLLSEGNIPEALQAVQEEISPIDDRWASESYRRLVCGNMLRALMKEAL